MSRQAEFLLLTENNQWASTAIDSIVQLYSDYEHILVVAKERQQLQQLDEQLWQGSGTQFVPYSLDSECYGSSTVVLLTDSQPERHRFRALLNIGAKISERPEQFQMIIELVLNNEASKQNAREHYKIYRHLGFIVNHRELKAND